MSVRFRILPVLVFFAGFLPVPADAAVELARGGQPPVVLEDIYQREGIHYLAVDEVLSALQLKGRWDSVEHVFRIQTPRGTAVISPGSEYLRLGDSFYALSDRPRFIDGRLRVPEEFVRIRIPTLLGEAILYRNLDPSSRPEEESPLDRLFALLLRKSSADRSGQLLRGVIIDSGHGGQDVGALGPGGEKEKVIVLDVARRLEKLLKMRLGIPVQLTRSGDYGLKQQERFQVAAGSDMDAMVLLHTQGALSPAPRGITLVIRPREEGAAGSLVAGEGESVSLARHLAKALAREGLEVAGILRAPLVPLGRGDLPTVLIELGYLSNSADLTMLRDPAGQERLAEALFAGLRSFAEDQRKENAR